MAIGERKDNEVHQCVINQKQGNNAETLNTMGKYWLSKSRIFQYTIIGTEVNTLMLTKGEQF